MVQNDQVVGNQSQFATNPVTPKLFITIDDDMPFNDDNDEDDIWISVMIILLGVALPR